MNDQLVLMLITKLLGEIARIEQLNRDSFLIGGDVFGGIGLQVQRHSG